MNDVMKIEAVCMVRENMETLEKLPKVRFPRNSTIWYDSFLKEFQSFSEDEKRMAMRTHLLNEISVGTNQRTDGGKYN